MAVKNTAELSIELAIDLVELLKEMHPHIVANPNKKLRFTAIRLLATLASEAVAGIESAQEEEAKK
jgi:hypothetical protein